MASGCNFRPMTVGVVIIWYRSSELLLGTKDYTAAIDMWASGLVVTEFLWNAPLLPGNIAVEELALIIELIRSPSRD
jgi:serine/threonine protein kinase